MSVSSMADMAFARRKDVGNPDEGLRDLGRVAEERGQKPETATTASSAIAAIAAYIPTEVLTVYVAILATFGVTVPVEGSAGTETLAATAPTPVMLYVIFLVLAPLVVWGLYAAKARQAGRKLPVSIGAWPKWEMFAGAVAYAIWAAALPASPLGAFDWFNQAAAGVVALIVSMLLGVFAPVFASGSLANS
jgi:hypothetical protein